MAYIAVYSRFFKTYSVQLDKNTSFKQVFPQNKQNYLVPSISN